jgi:diguanylate cyclase (GGDEF)-like protein/PAS domain S-box-containing protein
LALQARHLQEEIRPPGRSEARAAGALLMAGAGLVVLSLALPHPEGVHLVPVLSITAAMLVAGMLCWAFAARFTALAVHAVIAVTVLATGALVWQSGVAVGQFGSIYVWATLICAYFFPRRIAAAHLTWLLVVYAVALALVPSTAGLSPLTKWLFTAVSLTVVMLFTGNIVARRYRADARARRFFDLAQDMLCTMDMSGRCIEVNGAWLHKLGYTAAEMQGKRLLEFTHPEDRERALAEALGVFAGKPSSGLETRVQAKDGSWHWIRTSSVLEAGEGLVYARSTDITERKELAAEREALLEEVELLARSDALTGLPNRRALDDHLPREMARTMRSGGDLCLAIVDIDNFKTYNDTFGHLAGDAVLRECAIAWDGQLRGEDTIVRFGGEEFLVVLPDCDLDVATEIVERLRAATASAQTCSAGLALWRPGETVDELVARADDALYRAKASGRDRLERAAVTVSD